MNNLKNSFEKEISFIELIVDSTNNSLSATVLRCLTGLINVNNIINTYDNNSDNLYKQFKA